MSTQPPSSDAVVAATNGDSAAGDKKEAPAAGRKNSAGTHPPRDRKPSSNGAAVKEGGDAKKNGGKPSNGAAVDQNGFQQQRQRRRTNTRGNSETSPPEGQGNNRNRNKSQTNNGGGSNSKDWRKKDGSVSQQQPANGGSRDRSGSERQRTDSEKRHKSTNSVTKAGGAGGNGSSSTAPRRSKLSTQSGASQGDGLDYGNYEELEEPFSDSDDDVSSRPRMPTKMQLPIPRGRIRTLSGTVPIVGFSPKWGGPTMCLSCLHFFDLPEELESFSEHLLKEHHIVVAEMGLIVDPKRYIEHWRQRFAKESIDNVFPRIEPTDEASPYHGKIDYYFEMSPKLQEDFQLRQRLAMRRLEEALSCQQREREDTNFSQQCIFCRYTARGNRSKIIHHLYMIHHLNLGSPDNLVFVTEYIEHLKEKLVRNECIYCEKIFADRNTLMDHMRKRNHREVNPRNHYYDKFYIINYLELGKRWLDVLAEDFEDTTMTTFQDSDEEEEEDSWCEWQEDNCDADETRVLCLCCEESAESVPALAEHMKAKHGDFDLMAVMTAEGMGTYERAKLINYIRKQNYNSCCWICGKTNLGNWLAVYKHIDEEHKPVKMPETCVWNTEDELVPLFGNDHLIWMLESTLDPEAAAASDAAAGDRSSSPKTRIAQLVAESKENTVQGVIAEDLPDLPELEELENVF